MTTLVASARRSARSAARCGLVGKALVVAPRQLTMNRPRRDRRLASRFDVNREYAGPIPADMIQGCDREPYSESRRVVRINE